MDRKHVLVLALIEAVLKMLLIGVLKLSPRVISVLLLVVLQFPLSFSPHP